MRESPPRLKHDRELGPLLDAAEKAEAVSPARIAVAGVAVKAALAGKAAASGLGIAIGVSVALVGSGAVAYRVLHAPEDKVTATAPAPAHVAPAPSREAMAAPDRAPTAAEPPTPTPAPAQDVVVPSPSPSPAPTPAPAPNRPTVAPRTPTVAASSIGERAPASEPSRTPNAPASNEGSRPEEQPATPQPEKPVPPPPPTPSELPAQLALYESARTEAAHGKPAAALAILDKLLADYPSTPLRADIELSRAEQLVRAKRFDEAATAFETLSQSPAHQGRRGELLRTLGDVRRSQHDCTRALEAYDRAVAAGLSPAEQKRVANGRAACERQ